VTLEWADGFEARVAATREEQAQDDTTDEDEKARPKKRRLQLGRGREDEEAPPAALTAMMEDRKADEAAAREAARIRLSDETWASIRERAASAGITTGLEDDGAVLRLSLGEAAG
jgi:hypothetical protein